MMIVMVKVMLGGIGPGGSGSASDGFVGDSAPDTKASTGGQRTSAGGADVGRVILGTGHRDGLRGGAARHALNGLDRSGHGLIVRLGPAKVGGETLKKICDLLAFDRLLVVLAGLPRRTIILLGAGRVRIVFGHGILIADIVGEFAS
jgi:hypothetical protein